MRVAALASLCLVLCSIGFVISCEDKDVQMIAAALGDINNVEGLAGWMNIKFGPIRENCASSMALAKCYRRSLVRSYCGKSGHGPQQVAEDIANILEKDMKNKRVAQILRQLKFTQSNKERDDEQQVCDPEDSLCQSSTPSSSSNSGNSKIIPERWLTKEPTIRQLSLIRYTDSEGEEQTFRLITQVQNQCEYLGIELGFEPATVTGLKRSHGSTTEFCKAVLQKWIDGGRDVTWDKLLQTLIDIEAGQIANHLREALNAFFEWNGLSIEYNDDQQHEEDRKQYNEAMTKGYVESALALLILEGVTGSGKSLFKLLVLGLPVPEFSPSTPLVESAVRSMSICQVAVDDGIKWDTVEPQDMMDMVAKTIKNRALVLELALIDSSQLAFGISVDLASSETPSEQDSSQLWLQAQETVAKKVPESSANFVFLDALNEIKIDSELIKKINKPSTTVQKLIDVDFIYLLDSGGQPAFREMLPHFVQQASAIVLMQKLNESLNFKPTIRYREKEGKVDNGYTSQLTNEQILYQYVQGVQSLKSKVFIVGTHRDKEGERVRMRQGK